LPKKTSLAPRVRVSSVRREVEVQARWRKGILRRDPRAAKGAGEGAFEADGKSIVMRLLPAAEEFRHAGFLFFAGW